MALLISLPATHTHYYRPSSASMISDSSSLSCTASCTHSTWYSSAKWNDLASCLKSISSVSRPLHWVSYPNSRWKCFLRCSVGERSHLSELDWRAWSWARRTLKRIFLAVQSRPSHRYEQNRTRWSKALIGSFCARLAYVSSVCRATLTYVEGSKRVSAFIWANASCRNMIWTVLYSTHSIGATYLTGWLWAGCGSFSRA